MIEKAISDIRKAADLLGNPIVLCSFGKDSMVLLDLAMKADKTIPVLYFSMPFAQKKNSFSHRIMEEWGLTVYSYPHGAVDFLYRNKQMDVYYIYDTVGSGLCLARGLVRTDAPSLCIKRDFLNQPLTPSYMYKWNVTFSGHKDCDVDPVMGAIPLKSAMKPLGKTVLSYPLKDWSDDDIWRYIKKNNIPYNKERYDFKNIEFNNDYYECCFKCLDPLEDGLVFCYCENKEIINEGKNIDYGSKYMMFKKFLEV